MCLLLYGDGRGRGCHLVWYSLNGLRQYYCNIPSVDQAGEQQQLRRFCRVTKAIHSIRRIHEVDELGLKNIPVGTLAHLPHRIPSANNYTDQCPKLNPFFALKVAHDSRLEPSCWYLSTGLLVVEKSTVFGREGVNAESTIQIPVLVSTLHTYTAPTPHYYSSHVRNQCFLLTYWSRTTKHL